MVEFGHVESTFCVQMQVILDNPGTAPQLEPNVTVPAFVTARQAVLATLTRETHPDEH
jgi:hypothetical protein